MSKIWVVGGNGQLGKELKLLSEKDKKNEYLFSDLPDFDIQDDKQIAKISKEFVPEIVINAAAYTNVDLAEEEPDKAFAINASAVGKLAEICSKQKAFLIHISTDFVFDGKRSRPYNENISACPGGTYASSKYKGEVEVLLNTKHAAIIRTSWLYSNHGHNFMKTIIQKGSKGNELKVVFDQCGTPTWAADLAEVCLRMAENKSKIKCVELFHYSNEGVASWYDFAWEILTIAGEKPNIVPVGTEEFPRPAPRPAYSVMDKKKIREFLGISIPHWKESLAKCIKLEKRK
ncbi:MAG: dTDP-4-dehydrorhamnose reductase [Marinilabiliales bacterium]|nr:MAG: dTDP-4-dehydrorhamnose reductase [Marinilabiliales bacterium]